MREIKFRAWDGKKMMEPYSVRNGMAFIIKQCDKNELSIIGEDGSRYYKNWDIDVSTDYPLMQYTGLKDKNGVEIYEGDVLKQTIGRHYWIYIVQQSSSAQFGNNLWAIQVKNNLTTNESEVGEYEAVYTYQEQEETPHSWNHCPSGKDVEVIGNIYQNPDLLQEK